MNEEEPRQNTDFDRTQGTFDPTDRELEVVGGEGYPPHEHRFVGDRCEVCGAVRKRRSAA